MNPPPALYGAMSRERKPFTYTPGGLDLSEIKSERMAKRLMRNAMNQGVETPVQQIQSPPAITNPIVVPNFNCMPVQVFPTMNLPANPKSLLRTRSNPDNPKDPTQRTQQQSKIPKLNKIENNAPHTQVNNSHPYYQRPFSMHDNVTTTNNRNTLPRTNYGSNDTVVLPEICYEAEYFQSPLRNNCVAFKPIDEIDKSSNESITTPPTQEPNCVLIDKSTPQIESGNDIKINVNEISQTAKLETIVSTNNDLDFKTDDVRLLITSDHLKENTNKDLDNNTENIELNVTPENGTLHNRENFSMDTSSYLTFTPRLSQERSPVEQQSRTDDEQKQVKVTKKQVKKETKSEVRNGGQNGDANAETELTVKLPTKKSAAKTETNVKVVQKQLPDGSIEEIETTTTKTTVDGKTTIATKTKTTIIPKQEEEEVEEEVEEEETEESNGAVVAQEVEENGDKEVEEVTEENLIEENEPTVENGDAVVTNEERSETTTTTTKKVTVVQNDHSEDEEEVVEEEEEEEEEIIEEKKPVVVKESVREVDTSKEEVVEEQSEVEEEEVETQDKVEITEKEVEAEEEEEEEVIEEEKQESVENKSNSDDKIKEKEEVEETVKQEEAPAEVTKDEESEYTEEEYESEKEEVAKPEKEVSKPEEEVPKPNEPEETKSEAKEEPKQSEETYEEKKQTSAPEPASESAQAKPEISAQAPQSEPHVAPREPSIPLEKVEDVEIKPIGPVSQSVTKSHSENTEIITTERPSGPLSTQTEYNRIENIVTVNRTTKTLDQSYENTIQQGLPSVKTYFPPTIGKLPTSPLPSTPYQPVYPPVANPPTERRHSLLLERLSMERQMPTADIYHNNYQSFDQTQWTQEPQAEVLTVSNVKPSKITNQQWYQQSKKETETYNSVAPATPITPSWKQPPQQHTIHQPQPQPQVQPQHQPQAQTQYQPYQPPQAQPQYQPQPQPQPQAQPVYQPSYSENTTNTYQQSSYSYKPKPTTWSNNSTVNTETSTTYNTQPNQYSFLNKNSTESYQKTTQQYSSSYVPPPWEQDSNYVADTSNQYQPPPPTNQYNPPPSASTFSNTNQSWAPEPPKSKFSKPPPTAYIPPAPNQSFVKTVGAEPPRVPGKKTYYSEYERRYITVPESTYVPNETKPSFQPQPDPSPQYYYDNNEPAEAVEPQWRKELREFTENTSQTQNTEHVSVKPPWEDDPIYAKTPAAAPTTPTWSQTLRPRSWRERSFESEYVGSQEVTKNNTLGRGRPLSSYGKSNIETIPERPRGVSVDRYNPNIYQSPALAEHPPVPTNTFNVVPPAKSYHNPSVPAYHTQSRASAEPREQPASYQQPRQWGESRASPLQSRSFKYLQWITGTDN